MNGSLTSSNVYFLPQRSTATETSRRSSPRLSVWTRLTRAYWRLRFTTAEVWSILRRGRHFLADDDSILTYRVAEDRSRPRYAVPARVIDFESARQRLRGAANA